MSKIAVVSTYPPFRCAIAIYAQNLARALQAEGHEVVVLSEGGGADAGPGGDLAVADVYSREGDFRAPLLQRVREEKPEVVHFQHAPDLFPDNGLLTSLLRGCAATGAKVLITLHTVYEDQKWRDFFASIDGEVHFVVHNELCARTLRATIRESEIHVIPHGTLFEELPSKEGARRHLGLPADDRIFLFFGSIHVQKNLHTIVRAFRRIEDSSLGGARPRMVIAGRPWSDRAYNKLYVWANKLLLGRGSDQITWRASYIADEDVPHYIASADVLLLPYWQKYNSSSGVFHQAMAARLPVLCSDSPKFDEIKQDMGEPSSVFLPTHSVRRWAAAMKRMATDDGLREDVAESLHEYGKKTAWDVVARQHLAAFDVSSGGAVTPQRGSTSTAAD